MWNNLLQSWEKVLLEHENCTALVDTISEKEVTFSALQASSDVLMQELPQQASWEGHLWVLAVSDRVQWMTVFLSAIRLGAAVMPVEPQKEARLLEMATERGAALLFTDSAIKKLEGDALPKETFLIKMTSGTTGKPAALHFDEASMCADGRQIIASMGIRQTDRNYAVLPLGHSYGLGNLVMPFFLQGTPLILASSPYPQVMLDEIKRWGASVLPIVPPLVKALSSVDVGETPGSLRLVISAGSRLDPAQARRFREVTGLPVHNFYGSSETGGICFDRGGFRSEADGAVGTALEGVRLSVDKEGRILVESPATCQELRADGPVKLHDFGEIDPAGVLCLKGRATDVIKIAGRRVALSEVEAAIRELRDVEDAYVSTRLRRSGEPRMCALYAGALEPDLVREAIAAQLPEWKVPKRIYKVKSVPYTGRGKKDKDALEKLMDGLMRQA